MRRHSDWPQRFSLHRANAVRVPVATGENDCALFAAGFVAALTGEDLSRGVRGYRSYREGLAMFGVRRLRDIADRALPRLAPALAQRGDVAWVVEPSAPDHRRRAGYMIFDGAQLVGPGGVTRPRSAARLAWKVG